MALRMSALVETRHPTASPLQAVWGYLSGEWPPERGVPCASCGGPADPEHLRPTNGPMRDRIRFADPHRSAICPACAAMAAPPNGYKKWAAQGRRHWVALVQARGVTSAIGLMVAADGTGHWQPLMATDPASATQWLSTLTTWTRWPAVIASRPWELTNTRRWFRAWAWSTPGRLVLPIEDRVFVTSLPRLQETWAQAQPVLDLLAMEADLHNSQARQTLWTRWRAHPDQVPAAIQAWYAVENVNPSGARAYLERWFPALRRPGPPLRRTKEDEDA